MHVNILKENAIVIHYYDVCVLSKLYSSDMGNLKQTQDLRERTILFTQLFMYDSRAKNNLNGLLLDSLYHRRALCKISRTSGQGRIKLKANEEFTILRV